MALQEAPSLRAGNLKYTEKGREFMARRSDGEQQVDRSPDRQGEGGRSEQTEGAPEDGQEPQLDLIYRVDQRPSTRDMAIYALQWVLIMFYGAVWGIAIVGVGLGFDGQILASYMGRVVLFIGLATLAQAWFGHQMGMLSGPNIIPSLAIVAAFTAQDLDYALQSFNALAIGGVVVGVIALLGWLQQIRRVWTPLVLGSMVMMIGLAVSVTGMELIAEFEFGWSFYVGIVLAILVGYLSLRGHGFLASTSIGITIILGYIVFMVTGQFDWGLVAMMPALSVPALFPFGLTMPPLDLILIMTLVTLLASLNMYGNITAFGGLVGEGLEERRVKRSFGIFGFVENALAGVFGVPGYVAYGENLGIVTLTRVASRYPIIVAGVIFIALSFFGFMAGLMAAMPRPLAGAILLGVAAQVIGIGANNWMATPEFGRREQYIVSFSIFLTLGLYLLPEDLLNLLPRVIQTLFTNPVVFVILVVMFLEQIVFRNPERTTTVG